MAIERSIRINVESGRAKAELRSLQGSLRDTDRSATGAATATRALGAAIAGFASIATVRQVGQYADSYTQLQNQLRLVADSTEELSSATNSLFNIAQDTRNSFEGTVDLYARLARSTRELGVSNERLLAVTSTVNKAISVSGTTAASAQAALFQLGQGLGAGALRGEELNSVLEQTPRLAQAIADGLGVSIAELRELGQEGQITAERVIAALENQARVIDGEYSKTSSTIEQAFGKINNELIKYIGEADKATGITKSFTSTLDQFGNNFEEIADTVVGVAVPAFTALAAVIAGRVVVATASHTKALIANAAASLTSTRTITGVSAVLGVQQKAFAAATVRANAYTLASRAAVGSLALFGGPAGAAITAATALGIYASSVDEAKLRSEGAIGPIDQLAISLKELFDVISGKQEQDIGNAIIAGFAKNSKEQLEALIVSTSEQIKRLNDKQSEAGDGFFSKDFSADIEAQEEQLRRLSAAYAIVTERTKQANRANGDGSDAVGALVDSYTAYREKLDRAFAINQKYNELIKDITKNVKDQAKATELIELAEKNRSRELDALNRKNEKLVDTYKDLLAELDPVAAISIRYQKTLDRIAKSSATAAEKEILRSKAAQQAAKDLEIANERLERQAEKATTGIGGAFEDYAKDAIDANDEVEEATTRALGNLEDSLVEFSKTGKLSFKSLVDGILEDILRLQVRQNITGPLSEALGGIFKQGSSQSGGSSTGGLIEGILGGASFFARGGVIDSPTLLGTSGGSPAIGGEAGPEAVLPLTRTSGGDLGVKASVAGSGGVVLNIVNETGEAIQQQNISQSQGPNGESVITATITKVVNSQFGSGAFDKALNTRFGITSRGF